MFFLRPLEAFLNISRGNSIDSDCLKLIPLYKEYIKKEYLKLIDLKNI
jgi:hypothetical protein